MQYIIRTKHIGSGNVTEFKTVELDKRVYNDHMEVARIIATKCGIVGKVVTVGGLNSGKMDLYFETTKTTNGKANDSAGIRYMCYRVTEIKVETVVSMRRVCDLLISAFEGGSTYWAQSAYYAKEDELQKTHTRSIWYDMPELFNVPANEVIFNMHYDDPEGREGEGKGRKAVTRADIDKGVSLFATKAPRHFADMITENDDADTGDILLQYIILNDHIYG